MQQERGTHVHSVTLFFLYANLELATHTLSIGYRWLPSLLPPHGRPGTETSRITLLEKSIVKLTHHPRGRP